MNQITDIPALRLDDLDAVTNFYERLADNDAIGTRQLLADDVVLHVPGNHPLAGDHTGPTAVLGFVVASRGLTDDGEHIELLDLLVGARTVAAWCRVTARRGGRELDNTTVHLVRVADGRIVEIWLHNFDDIAVNDFWNAA